MSALDQPRLGKTSSKARWMRLAGNLGAPVLFFLLVWAAHPFLDVFAFDPDEGNNLMKALLVADGHQLYSEIWSDQPALFTHVLHGWLELTSWSVESARLLVLLCSCALLWALYQCVRLTSGHAGAVASCVLLVLSAGYVRLSVSVMLGVPSLMLAMLSLYAVLRYRQAGQPAWIVVSGVLLALALFIKMWVGILVPVAVLAVVLSRPSSRTPWLRPVAYWVVGFASVATLLFLVTTTPGATEQLISPHIDVREAQGFEANTRAFWRLVGGDLFIVITALAGLMVVMIRRTWIALVPAAWALVAFAVLAGHQPLWYHHYLLVSIPLCWCAGFGVNALMTRRWLSAAWPWRGPATVPTWSLGLAFAACIGLVGWRAPGIARQEFGKWSSQPQTRDRHLLQLMSQFKSQTRWVVTDRQILPFRAGLRVPPALAVTSLKRRWSGHLSGELLISVLEEYRPEQIVLSGSRIPMTERLRAYLEPRYELIYGDPWGGCVLLRNDLADASLAAVTRAAAAVPESWEAQLSLGHQLTRAGRAGAASAAYDRALGRLPRASKYDGVRQELVGLTSTGDP